MNWDLADLVVNTSCQAVAGSLVVYPVSGLRDHTAHLIIEIDRFHSLAFELLMEEVLVWVEVEALEG